MPSAPRSTAARPWKGLFRGETVDARFTRTDGCELARWNRHSFLFPLKPGS
jgi:hypothetical protein